MSDSIFIHEKAIVESGARVREGTRVWAFAHILPAFPITEIIHNEVLSLPMGPHLTDMDLQQVIDGIVSFF